MATTETLRALYTPIAPQLVEVRALVDSIWRDALKLVRVPAVDIPGAGGKFLRPALCLLSAGTAGAANLDQYSRLAAAYEGLHLASLAHDDVIDHAMMRRGHNSLNALWNNHAAVLGGDYLVARAVEMIAEYDCCTVVSKAVSSVRHMAECELFFFGRPPGEAVPEECLQLAEGKTASLFAAACSAPATILKSQHESALWQFGNSLGVAFQLVDDLLDLTGTTDNLGKPSCGDIAEGKSTLPILYMLKALPAEDKARLSSLQETDLSEQDRQWVHDAVIQTGAVAKTQAVAKAYADQALAALASIPQNPYHHSMEGLMHFVLDRNT
jgi:octaprenyl-diphosphate synthase